LPNAPIGVRAAAAMTTESDGGMGNHLTEVALDLSRLENLLGVAAAR
jgi:hypothetical protein